MPGWLFLLGGLLVWAVHFFSLYAIASLFLTSPLARVLTLLISLACLAADAFIFRRALRMAAASSQEKWMKSVALSGAGLSAVAVIWQALPAVLI